MGRKHLDNWVRIRGLIAYDVEDHHVRTVALLGRLQALTIQGCMTDDGLSPLSRLPAITSLRIASPHVTDAGILHLGRSKTLKALDVRGTRTTRAGIQKLLDLAVDLDVND